MAAARAYVPRLLQPRACTTATPPRSRPRGSSPRRRSRSPCSRCWRARARRDRRTPGRWRRVFAAGLLALALVILTGLIQARAGLRTWLALLVAPWYSAWKAVVQLRALASVLRRDDYYPPTARSLTRWIDFGSPDSQRGHSGAEPSASVSTLAKASGQSRMGLAAVCETGGFRCRVGCCRSSYSRTSGERSRHRTVRRSDRGP